MCNFLLNKATLLLLTLSLSAVSASANESSDSANNATTAILPKSVISDPTKPTGYREKTSQAAARYRLESILLGSARKLAIINGKNFAEGDKTKLGTIVKINRDNVVIQGSKRHVLKLENQSIKKRLGKQ